MTDEQMNQALIDLQTQINNITARDTSQTTAIANRLTTNETDITNLRGSVNAVGTEVDDIHEEVHELQIAVANQQSEINNIELVMAEGFGDIDTMKATEESLQQQITDMDAEHHGELHQLAQAIDTNTSAISNLNLRMADVPDYEVMPEAEFENIGDPEPGTFYYVYEED